MRKKNGLRGLNEREKERNGERKRKCKLFIRLSDLNKIVMNTKGTSYLECVLTLRELVAQFLHFDP